MPSNTQRRSGSSGRRPNQRPATKAPKVSEPTEPTADAEPLTEPTAESTETSAEALTEAPETSTESSAETAEPSGETTVEPSASSAETDAEPSTEPVAKPAAKPKTQSAAAKSLAAKTAARSAARTDAAKSAASKGSKGSRPKGAASAGGRRPPGKPGTKGRGPVKPVKPGLPWGSIVIGGIVVIVALSIVGYGIWYSWDASRPFGERRAQQIDGMTNYRAEGVKWLTRNHVEGKLKYKTSPPVGGNHNPTWENCEGDVYGTQIPNEHAVHSLEHGAVWVTYNPDLPAAEVAKLAAKVKGKDYMLMSPYPGLDKPISLQAWGLQLKVNSANDPRIDKFITQFRRNASVEPGASCSQGVTVTGTTPLTAEQVQAAQQAQQQAGS
jgi:hypothetical protein